MTSDQAPTRVVLIRHGESQVAVDQVVGGHEGCTGLSDLGRRQATLLRERLARTGELADASALYASVLPRAIETAEIIAPALGDLKIRTECALCEVHTGDEVDGMTWVELRERFGEFVYEPGSEHVPWGPGTETWAEFIHRASRQLWQLVRDHEGETVVVACHGGIVNASFTAFGNLPVARRGFWMLSENTAMTEWQHDPDLPQPWLLVRYNDAAHLAAGGSSEP
jgi:2,3-bisphosphoglycerate-dependent phosphoglycerate mutase